MAPLDPRLLRIFAWCGPALIVAFSIGLIALAGFFPPPSPGDDSASTAHTFAEDQTAIRLGCLLMIIGLILLVPWGIALANLTRSPTAAGSPLLVQGQLTCLGISTAMIVLIPTMWAVAAFRPEQVDPDVTQLVNDSGWFLLLFVWPPFSAWNVFTAAAILREGEAGLLPRWCGYLCLWDALLLAPGGLMAFFKSGPFAWDGVMAFYIPLSVFFVWMVAMTTAMLTAARRADAAAPRAITAPVS